jgi:hypothetical protein
LRGYPTQEVLVSQAVAKLTKGLHRAVTTREVAQQLKWKEALVYKHLKAAVRHRLVEYESGTHEKNVKRLTIRNEAKTHFLPTPKSVFTSNREIGAEVAYTDPFSGKQKILRREQA